jgi:hypothetical protein
MNETTLVDQVRRFAADWFHRLDVHAPSADYRPLIAGDAFELQVPEGVFRGFDGFRQWYERALQLFFDEAHTLKVVEPAEAGGDVRVQVVVNWQASTWTAPAARSQRIKLDAYQTWVLGRSGNSFVIKTYIVGRMEYEPGSAKL